MYGGEHVGDSAILGGVLQRLQSTWGTRRATVVSFRPDRTRRWIQSLHVEMDMNVISYEEAVSQVEDVDAVVLAGGPVMDLFGVLLMQIMVVDHAKRQNKPFIIEGVGVGPFKSMIGRWLASLLFKSADQIRVRSRGSQLDRMVSGLPVLVGPDPAFDYLASRNQVAADDGVISTAIKNALEDGSGVLKIGLNLRPLWDKYTPSDKSTGDSENSFLLEFSRALVTYSTTSPKSVQYFFFPMNSDQYGFSDLNMAYRLKDLLPADFPLFIWESEPGVDELIEHIRQMDTVIAMRFHAAIFSLSQNVPTVGIDYSFGKPGKVSELFSEQGQGHLASRIDTFAASWLVNRLMEIAPGS
jgi:polysaccharide pyruvyl transferase WcaK-like protein